MNEPDKIDEKPIELTGKEMAFAIKFVIGFLSDHGLATKEINDELTNCKNAFEKFGTKKG